MIKSNLKQNLFDFSVFAVKIAVLCFLALYFRKGLSVPTELFVSNLYAGISVLGVVVGITAIALSSVVKSLSIDLNFEGLNTVYPFLIKVVKTITVYYALLWLISNFGDLSYRWILNNKEDAILLGVCIVFLHPIAMAGWKSARPSSKK